MKTDKTTEPDSLNKPATPRKLSDLKVRDEVACGSNGSSWRLRLVSRVTAKRIMVNGDVYDRESGRAIAAYSTTQISIAPDAMAAARQHHAERTARAETARLAQEEADRYHAARHAALLRMSQYVQAMHDPSFDGTISYVFRDGLRHDLNLSDLALVVGMAREGCR